MRYRSTQNWTNLNNMKGLLFFVQRLEELTFSYTLDSYKSSTMSLQSLIQEAFHLIEETSGSDKEQADKILNSVENIVNEIKRRIKGNWIAKSVCSVDIDLEIVFDKSNTNLRDFMRRLQILNAELNDESYFAEIADNVIKLSDQPNQKRKLELLAREFSSFLQNRGVSRAHINSSLIYFFFNEQKIADPLEFKVFCQIVYPHYHDFRVIFGVSSLILSLNSDLLASRKMVVVNQPIESIPDEELDELRREGGLECLLSVFVQATDYNSAVSIALSRLEAVYNFYRIFSHKEEMSVSQIALVEQGCCEGVRRKVETPKNNMHFIRDMRSVKAASTLKRFSERIYLDVGEDAVKFRNIVNIHGMSLESKSQDIQLVNLWTCLETIAPTDRGNSKISNVIGRVIPVIMLGYYNRLIVNALFDVLRWNRRALTDVLQRSYADEHSDLKDRFVALLAKNENEEYLKDLYMKFDDFELLRYRISDLSIVLKNVNRALEKLDYHEDMVKWQLHRIYRTRNGIVHAGESPSFTKYIVENAHDYFDQTLLFCLEVSSWKRGFDTFLACFDYAESQYNQYKRHLKNNINTNIIWTLPKSKGKSFIFPGEE